MLDFFNQPRARWMAIVIGWTAIAFLWDPNCNPLAADDGPKTKTPPANADSKPKESRPSPATSSPAKPTQAKPAQTGSAQTGSSQTKQPQTKPSPAKSDANKSEVNKSDANKSAEPELVFVRTLEGDNRKPVVLQTAIVTFQAVGGKYDGAEVDLIGAIHIADKSYYKELNERFKRYDALLYEMVSDPKMVKELKPETSKKDRSAVSAMQSGMKDMLGLSFQLDEIDYQAKNFVHADMNPEEFSESLAQRQEGLMQFMMRSMGSSLAMQSSRKTNDIDMLAALFSGNRELAMKRVLAEQIEQMDGQLAAISGDDGKSTLITERNQKALQVLKREMDAGKKHMGIFYGAGHFRHMSEELARQFSMRVVNTQWLDAWDMH